MKTFSFLDFLKNKDGVTSIEYGILAAGLAVAIAAIVAPEGTFRQALDDIFDAVVEAVPTGEDPAGTE